MVSGSGLGMSSLQSLLHLHDSELFRAKRHCLCQPLFGALKDSILLASLPFLETRIALPALLSSHPATCVV